MSKLAVFVVLALCAVQAFGLYVSVREDKPDVDEIVKGLEHRMDLKIQVILHHLGLKEYQAQECVDTANKSVVQMTDKLRADATECEADSKNADDPMFKCLKAALKVAIATGRTIGEDFTVCATPAE